MSGTAALAAARKRRANPQPNVSNSYSNSNMNQNMNQNMNSNQKLGSNTIENDKEEFPKATNPAMLLMQHNILIQRLRYILMLTF